jgi:hypothetical protein
MIQLYLLLTLYEELRQKDVTWENQYADAAEVDTLVGRPKGFHKRVLTIGQVSWWRSRTSRLLLVSSAWSCSHVKEGRNSRKAPMSV